VLESALERLVGPVRLSVAGRTDAGVHAEGQVASFPSEGSVDVERIVSALNGVLAPEVVVHRAILAPAGFDARRSATAREYRYRINLGPWPDPFTPRFEWYRPGSLDLRAMHAAGRKLEGEHDFASFCRRPQGGGGAVRTVHRLTVSTAGDRLEIQVRADSFLHQMVRSIVGTLVDVGRGRIDPSRIPAILEARSRAAAGPIAPPHGLTLVKVTYGRQRGSTRSDHSA
jgi:tRNA pseudouridine38-40 synthase